jgi:hypothetical protein
MSEEPLEPKPSKLKLSSSLNRPDTPQNAPTDQAGFNPATSPGDVPPEEVLKTEEKQSPAPEQTRPSPPQLQSQQSPATEQAHLPPPQLSTKQTPPIVDEDTAEKIDESIQQLPQETSRTNPLISVLIIAALLLILGAAGGGIWYILKSDQQTASGEHATAPAAAQPQTQAQAPSGPITQAKETIAKVPVMDLAEIEGSETVFVPSVPEPEAAPLNEALKDAVSQYLENVYIGAIRTGTRARIMVNGENYNMNDIVDPNTELRFIGIRDQRLVFKDRNGILYVKSF